MPMICYAKKNFHPRSVDLIRKANAIIAEYAAQGFILTLRQLYYQFVARGMLPNTLRNYKNLGTVISEARLAGLIDWDSIEDRTRNLMGRPAWEKPSQLVAHVGKRYHMDYWKGQDTRLEVWIEKDALTGVINRVCSDWDVDYFACRGHTSQSEQWRAGERIADYINDGQQVVILHLGDHDPSGIDMTRDNEDRLRMFIGMTADADQFEFKRVALNIDQVKKYNPPPNPVKFTDSRAKTYIAQFGKSCWELDALDPKVIETLIQDEITEYVDEDKMDAVKLKEQAGRRRLGRTAAALAKKGH